MQTCPTQCRDWLCNCDDNSNNLRSGTHGACVISPTSFIAFRNAIFIPIEYPCLLELLISIWEPKDSE